MKLKLILIFLSLFGIGFSQGGPLEKINFGNGIPGSGESIKSALKKCQDNDSILLTKIATHEVVTTYRTIIIVDTVHQDDRVIFKYKDGNPDPVILKPKPKKVPFWKDFHLTFMSGSMIASALGVLILLYFNLKPRKTNDHNNLSQM